MARPSGFQAEQKASGYMASVNPQRFKTRSLWPLANPIFKARKQYLLPWLQLITTSQVAPDKRAASVFSGYNKDGNKGALRLGVCPEVWRQIGRVTSAPPQKGPRFWLVPALFLHCHFTSFSLIFSLCVLAHNSIVEGLFPSLKDIILKHDNKTSKCRHYRYLIS